MSTSEMKLHSLSEMKDKYLGKLGTEERDHYEYELRMEVLGKMIKSTRQERKLTQEELGQLVGVQKAQISKLESSANSATVDTLLKIFTALKAEINFNVKIEQQRLEFEKDQKKVKTLLKRVKKTGGNAFEKKSEKNSKVNLGGPGKRTPRKTASRNRGIERKRDEKKKKK